MIEGSSEVKKRRHLRLAVELEPTKALESDTIPDRALAMRS